MAQHAADIAEDVMDELGALDWAPAILRQWADHLARTPSEKQRALRCALLLSSLHDTATQIEQPVTLLDITEGADNGIMLVTHLSQDRVRAALPRDRACPSDDEIAAALVEQSNKRKEALDAWTQDVEQATVLSLMSD